MHSSHRLQKCSNFRASFHAIDLNGDSYIEEKEWLAYCNGWMTPRPESKEICAQMFKAADERAPYGEIDYPEFKKGGSRCNTVDDGDCNFVQVNMASHANEHLRESLASWVRSRNSPHRASHLFGALLRRHRRRNKTQ